MESITLRDKQRTKQAFCTISAHGVSNFFAGNKPYFTAIVFFVEEDKKRRMPSFVCFAIDQIKSLGAFNTIK